MQHVKLGEIQYYDQGGYHTRVEVEIKNKKTQQIYKRIGDGKQIGNFHPIWVFAARILKKAGLSAENPIQLSKLLRI